MHVFNLTFQRRQDTIAACRLVLLHTYYGDLRAEYVTGSETKTASGAWNYQFFVNECDLPSGLQLSGICNNVIKEPYVSPWPKCCGCEATGDGNPLDLLGGLLVDSADIVGDETHHMLTLIQPVELVNWRTWVFEAGNTDTIIELLHGNAVVAEQTIPAGEFHTGDDVPTFDFSALQNNAQIRIRVTLSNGSASTPPKGLESFISVNL